MQILKLAFMAVYCLLFASCNDSGGSSVDYGKSSSLTIKITDTSVKNESIRSVEIEISQIDIRLNGEFSTLFEGVAVYDVQNLGAGVKDEIVQMPVEPGRVDQVRVYVKTASVYMEDGRVFDLDVPSGAQSGVKVDVAPALDVISGGVPYEFVLDFDLYQSLIPLGNSEKITGYNFQPVVRVSNKSYHANIYGSVESDMCTEDEYDDVVLGGNLVKAYQGVELVATTQSNREGKFEFVGLAPGKYDIFVEAPKHKTLWARREVSSVADARVEVRLAGRCAAVKGRVLSDNGTPDDEFDASVLEGALVQLYDLNGLLLEEVVSQADGAFEFSKRFEEELQVMVSDYEHYEETVELEINELYWPVMVVMSKKETNIY